MDPDSDVVYVDTDGDDSEDEDVSETSTSGDALFSNLQLFVVKKISKASTGFRPSVMCEGYLAELSKSSSGYILAPLGRDQQLSFKYEPPSPKFSRKRPSCVSYRLQLLHGSQFLYSLRGLPTALRCQRSVLAVEWGPVHLVFAASADLDTFLGTLKYVEVRQVETEKREEEASVATAGAGQRQQRHQGAAAVGISGGGAEGGSGTAVGEGGGGRVREPSIAGVSMTWAAAAAQLLAAEAGEAGATLCPGGPTMATTQGEATAAPATAPAAAAAAATAQSPTSRPDLLRWRRAAPLGLPMLTATVGLAVLAAAAAYLLGVGRGQGGERGSSMLGATPRRGS